MAGMNNDFILRAESILSGMKKGFFGKKLWENLELKYISEMPVESENLGLKGKIDRVMISKEKIVPFELKTRAAEKVYDSDEIQVTAYAMLLEEHFNQPISFGILESGNTKHEILIKPESRQKVLNLIKEINELKNPKYPQNFSKCQNCQLKEACENLVT